MQRAFCDEVRARSRAERTVLRLCERFSLDPGELLNDEDESEVPNASPAQTTIAAVDADITADATAAAAADLTLKATKGSVAFEEGHPEDDAGGPASALAGDSASALAGEAISAAEPTATLAEADANDAQAPVEEPLVVEASDVVPSEQQATASPPDHHTAEPVQEADSAAAVRSEPDQSDEQAEPVRQNSADAARESAGAVSSALRPGCPLEVVVGMDGERVVDHTSRCMLPVTEQKETATRPSDEEEQPSSSENLTAEECNVVPSCDENVTPPKSSDHTTDVSSDHTTEVSASVATPTTTENVQDEQPQGAAVDPTPAEAHLSDSFSDSATGDSDSESSGDGDFAESDPSSDETTDDDYDVSVISSDSHFASTESEEEELEEQEEDDTADAAFDHGGGDGGGDGTSQEGGTMSDLSPWSSSSASGDEDQTREVVDHSSERLVEDEAEVEY